MKIILKCTLIYIFTFLFTMFSSYAITHASMPQKPIAEFSTQFNLDNTPRVSNIKFASIALDQKIILPGETFSFNETVGPTTEERGYQMSKVIIDGKESKGFGGGVCQVSSTLFNTAQMAGLEIIERHPHTKEVEYIGEGKDAATSYGGVDLKFVNTYPFPIKINTYIYENSIHIQILKS